MQLNRGWIRWAGGAAAALLAVTLIAGCGEEKPPVNPPADPGKAMPAMSHDPAAPGAMAATAKVYACTHDKVVQATPGECPQCKMKLVEMAVSNPDPTVCIKTGEKITKPIYTIANGKVYALCCGDCEADLQKDPDGLVKKALENAAKTQ